MTEPEAPPPPRSADKPPRRAARKAKRPQAPGWAGGLRKLYDGVVAEPLPESFQELLRKLDQADDG